MKYVYYNFEKKKKSQFLYEVKSAERRVCRFSKSFNFALDIFVVAHEPCLYALISILWILYPRVKIMYQDNFHNMEINPPNHGDGSFLCFCAVVVPCMAMLEN